MQKLVVFNDDDEYARCVVPFLETHEAENGLFLGILDQLKSEPPASTPFMAQLLSGDQTVAAAIYRDRNLVITRGFEDFASELVALLMARGVDVPGVVGPSGCAQQLASVWAAARSCESTLGFDQGLYWSKAVEWPARVPGEMRPMKPRDIELIGDWIHAFQLEALPFEAGTLADARRNALARSGRNMTFIWVVEQTPVAMAALARPTRRGISVNAVYTPPEFRRHGYATNLVAFVTREGLKRGKEFCSLYTDMANPTSNSIYQKIGYRLFSHSRLYLFKY